METEILKMFLPTTCASVAPPRFRGGAGEMPVIADKTAYLTVAPVVHVACSPSLHPLGIPDNGWPGCGAKCGSKRECCGRHDPRHGLRAFQYLSRILPCPSFDQDGGGSRCCAPYDGNVADLERGQGADDGGGVDSGLVTVECDIVQVPDGEQTRESHAP